MMNRRMRGKEGRRLVDAHREEVADALVLEAHRERLRVEAPPMADIAHHAHVRQEAHLDLLEPLALAGFAAAARGVERKTAGAVTADARFAALCEQSTHGVPEPHVRGRAGTRRL